MKQRDWVIIGLLVVGWICVLGQPTAVSARLRRLFVDLGTPFVKLGDWLPTVHSRRELARENDRLRTENTRLQQRVAPFEETARENLALHRLLNFKEHARFRTLGAHVIGRDAANWWKSIQIDRGSQDGLRENLPVVDAAGLIGKTVAVTRGEARVLLLIDPDCKVSALLADSREPGVAAGLDSPLGLRPRCQMTYVARAATANPGALVVSSGLGGVFPKGLPIGKVVRAQLNGPSGLYQDLTIEPAVNFRKLEEVLVILE